jgi:23S rRNA pseudouridine1911/1915/1917 synthase
VSTTRHITADRGDARRRLDHVLRRHLRDVDAASRTRVQNWIEDGRVQVNGATVRRVASRAALGDSVTIDIPEHALAASPMMAAEDRELAVLYEDAGLIAVDKPAGMVVHPAYRNLSGTLMNALLSRARSWPTGHRPSVVGRLDKLTSGVVIVAKTAAMHAALQRALADSAAEKEYLAVSYGRTAARGTIDLCLSRDSTDRRRMIASPLNGAPSTTRVERLADAPAPRAGISLVRCRLVTGRTHQIRVHLAARGWPIVGDRVYGEPRWAAVADPALAAALRQFPRHALHAWRASLTHPATRRRVTIEAPIPADMNALSAACGLNRTFSDGRF